ncbi:MAG: hypothetical protein ACR2QJ_09175 [Geminicoccaceae bacterium]
MIDYYYEAPINLRGAIIMIRLSRILTVSAAVLLFGAGDIAAEDAGQRSAVLVDKIDTVVDPDTDRLQTIFKDIHQNPELGFMEERTAGIVADELSALGYEVKAGIGGTGVVGILENGPGPVVMWQADMDANAIREDTGLSHQSDVQVTIHDEVLSLRLRDEPLQHGLPHGIQSPLSRRLGDQVSL